MESNVSKGKSLAAVSLLCGVVLAACASATTGSGPSSPTRADDVVAQEQVTTADTAEAGSSPAPTLEPTPVPAVALPDMGPAPEIENEVWLNTESPQRLESLRGKVVLLEFWTFG